MLTTRFLFFLQAVLALAVWSLPSISRADLISVDAGSQDVIGLGYYGVSSQVIDASGSNNINASPYSISESWAPTVNTLTEFQWQVSFSDVAPAPPSGAASSATHTLIFTPTTDLQYALIVLTTGPWVYTLENLTNVSTLTSSTGNLQAGDKYELDTTYARATTESAYSGQLDLTLTPNSAVPEPSSFGLLGLGGVGLAIGAYRRRRAAVSSNQ